MGLFDRISDEDLAEELKRRKKRGGKVRVREFELDGSDVKRWLGIADDDDDDDDDGGDDTGGKKRGFFGD